MSAEREAGPDVDIARVRQIVLDDLRKVERRLAEGSDAPDPEHAGQLSVIRMAIAELLRLMPGTVPA